MLAPDFTPQFKRDYKRCGRKHADMKQLDDLMRLVLEDSEDSKSTLRQRHSMHVLHGSWRGSYECHVANAGDWLLIWRTGNGMAVFQRTGTHEELFR